MKFMTNVGMLMKEISLMQVATCGFLSGKRTGDNYYSYCTRTMTGVSYNEISTLLAVEPPVA